MADFHNALIYNELKTLAAILLRNTPLFPSRPPDESGPEEFPGASCVSLKITNGCVPKPMAASP
jgi:hypothetical protein